GVLFSHCVTSVIQFPFDEGPGQMLKSRSLFAVCFITLWFVSSETALQAEDKTKSYYLIGNSLTWDTSPSLLDGDVQWHVDCGKSLPYIMAHPEMPCVKTSTLWPQAL